MDVPGRTRRVGAPGPTRLGKRDWGNSPMPTRTRLQALEQVWSGAYALHHFEQRGPIPLELGGADAGDVAKLVE